MMIVLGLGANMASRWGSPRQTLERTTSLCGIHGVYVKDRAPIYESAPLGVREQPAFVNTVVSASTNLTPDALLRAVKALEAEAGRRRQRRWGPRALDIDILDYAGRVINWPSLPRRPLRMEARRAAMSRVRPDMRTYGRPSLMTPHPQLHLRAFVLQPLVDILPRWHHPVTGESARQLLAGLPRATGQHEGDVMRVLRDTA